MTTTMRNQLGLSPRPTKTGKKGGPKKSPIIRPNYQKELVLWIDRFNSYPFFGMRFTLIPFVPLIVFMFDSDSCIRRILTFLVNEEEMDTKETTSIPCPPEDEFVGRVKGLLTQIDLRWDELCEKFYYHNDEYIDVVISDYEYESPQQMVSDYIEEQLDTFTYKPMDSLESLLVFMHIMGDDVENHYPELFELFCEKMDCMCDYIYRGCYELPCKAWFDSLIVDTFSWIGSDMIDLYCSGNEQQVNHLENSFNLVSV